MNHELIEILKAFVLRDNGHEGLDKLCYQLRNSTCSRTRDACTNCVLIKGWTRNVPYPNMYLENTLRSLNEPGTIIHTQSIL